MGVSVFHYKTDTYADGTNTNLVMPSDWNSGHQVSLSLGGGEVIKYIQAGTNSVSSGTVSFGNGNGITFGMATDGVITGSVKTDYLTTTAAQTVQPVAYAAGGTTNNFSTLAFANSNGLSWSTGTQGIFPGTAILTTAAQSGHSHAMATTTTNGSNIVVATSNSNGYTIAVPSYLTTAMVSNAGSNFAGLSTGATGASITVNSQGINVNVPSGTDTWYATGANTIAGTNTTGTFANDQYVISGAGGVSVGISNNTVVISAPTGAGGTTNQTGPNIAASNGTITAGTVLFSNANGVSFGLNGSTMTASAAGGGGATLSRWMGPGMGLSSIISHAASVINGSIIIGMEQIPVNVSASKIGIVLGHSIVTSYNTSQVASLTLNMAVYGRLNSTAITMMSSGTQSFSMSWSSSTTTGVVGMREVYVPFNMNLTPGVYYVARQMSLTGNNASAATAHTISQFGVPTMSAISAAGDGYGVATAASNAAMVPFQGGFSVTSGAFPATIGLSDMVHTGTIYAHANYWREFVG